MVLAFCNNCNQMTNHNEALCLKCKNGGCGNKIIWTVNPIIHLVASGGDKTFCGLDKKGILNTSVGFSCNCITCLTEAQRRINKKIGKVK